MNNENWLYKIADAKPNLDTIDNIEKKVKDLQEWLKQEPNTNTSYARELLQEIKVLKDDLKFLYKQR